MKFISKTIYTILILFVGWLGNFFLDTQFVAGILAGWLMKEGYDSVARYILNLL